MAPQASKKCGLLPPDHHRIGSCTREPTGQAPPSAAVPVPLPAKRRRKSRMSPFFQPGFLSTDGACRNGRGARNGSCQRLPAPDIVLMHKL